MVVNYMKSVYSVKSVRKKIIAVLLLVLVYKLLWVITVPGINKEALNLIFSSSSWTGLSFFSDLMWGWLKNFSIILMWLSPYINASIIIQLLWVIFPKIGDLQKEGEQWQKKINKWTRYLTIPLAFLQSYGMILMLNSMAWGVPVMDTSSFTSVLFAMLIITTWTMFLVWLWELMTEYGIWSGTSIIITAWVLSAMPTSIMNYASNIPLLIALFVATLAVIYVIIKFTEWNRRVPVIYSRTGREEKSYFPIRINQAWMVPIIFSMSIITFPWIIGQILSKQNGELLKKVGTFLVKNFSMNNPSIWFTLIYFILIIGFAYFYVSITFNTDEVAESIQKRGWYIPWIRPGKDTSAYLAKVSGHLNLFGWSFLAFIAIIPMVTNLIFGKNIDLIISGSWLIIMVSVILDILRKIESEVKMFDYSKYR